MSAMSDKLVSVGLDDLTAARVENDLAVELADKKAQLETAQIKADFWAAEVTKLTTEIQQREGALGIAVIQETLK